MSGWIASAASWFSSVLRFCPGLCQHRAPPPPSPTFVLFAGGSAPDSDSEFSVVTGGVAGEPAATGVPPVFCANSFATLPGPELDRSGGNCYSGYNYGC